MICDKRALTSSFQRALTNRRNDGERIKSEEQRTIKTKRQKKKTADES